MKIAKLKRFIKSYSKLPKNIQNKFDEKLKIFELNPFEKSLNNHGLNKEFLGFRSINITGDFRAIFKEYPNGTYEFVDFLDIGTHSQLYR